MFLVKRIPRLLLLVHLQLRRLNLPAVDPLLSDFGSSLVECSVDAPLCLMKKLNTELCLLILSIDPSPLQSGFLEACL
ncbi:MAG: hypothetical protein ACRC61_21970, partial [Aeromonas salmonicida]